MEIPTSKPKTSMVPKKPKIIPIHCLHVTFSFNIGPAKKLVKIGYIETIRAEILTGTPM